MAWIFWRWLRLLLNGYLLLGATRAAPVAELLWRKRCPQLLSRPRNTKPAITAHVFRADTPTLLAASSRSFYDKQQHNDEYDDTAEEDLDDSVDDSSGSSPPSSTSAWPPWPFSLLLAKPRPPPTTTTTIAGSSSHDHHATTTTAHYSRAAVAWAFTKQSVRLAFKNLHDSATRLYMHLPPAAHPFIILAAIPRREQVLVEGGAGQVLTSYRVTIPLLSNAFARRVSFGLVGLAIVSWAHYDLHRRRSLVRLPLAGQYRDINRAILPPFLPEQVQVDFLGEATAATTADSDETGEGTSRTESSMDDEDEDESDVYLLPRRLSRHWYQFLETAPKPKSLPTTIRSWRRMRDVRQRERHNARRLAVYDELLALQALKKQTQRKKMTKRINNKNKLGLYMSKEDSRRQQLEQQGDDEEEEPLGYALVTGASRGIGRAIAVELARWQIPLILVARDIERLTALAYDLEACYGVKCCVLQADLAKPGVAASVHKTTQEAGLNVDILVNNAGFSRHGNAVDMPIESVNQMVQLNTVAPAMLTHLYGRDMKKRKRGRILMISSVCGAVAGIPSVALYSATKAFENSLAIGLAKEMEESGVGITCMMPGAVRDTNFRSGSKTDKALCWKIPFYPKRPHSIAEMGVRSMLRGDSEVTPGWLNRLFIKVVKPVLPQRLHNLVAEIMWNPLRLPFGRTQDERDASLQTEREVPTQPPPAPHQSLRPPQFNYRLPPRLLETDYVESEDEFEDEDEESDRKGDSGDSSTAKAHDDDLSSKSLTEETPDAVLDQTEKEIKAALEDILHPPKDSRGHSFGPSSVDSQQDTSEEYEELQAQRFLAR